MFKTVKRTSWFETNLQSNSFILACSHLRNPAHLLWAFSWYNFMKLWWRWWWWWPYGWWWWGGGWRWPCRQWWWWGWPWSAKAVDKSVKSNNGRGHKLSPPWWWWWWWSGLWWWWWWWWSGKMWYDSSDMLWYQMLSTKHHTPCKISRYLYCSLQARQYALAGHCRTFANCASWTLIAAALQSVQGHC